MNLRRQYSVVSYTERSQPKYSTDLLQRLWDHIS